MASYSFYVSGATLTPAVIDRIKEALRPYSVPGLRRSADFWRSESAPGQSVEDAVRNAEYARDHEVAAEQGGRSEVQRWFLTDERSVQSSWSNSAMDVPWDKAENYQSLTVAISSKGGVGADATVEAEASRSGIRVKVEVADSVSAASNEALDLPEILDLADQVKVALEATIDPAEAGLLAPTFRVFLGHGGDPQWKYIYRNLRDIHHVNVEAFESSQRAGYHTLVVIQQMIAASDVALVILTGEDLMKDDSLRARENAIHEVGLCQGALGIENTIVVLETGISEPSNIHGLTQIRFERGLLIDVEDQIVEALKQRRDVHDFIHSSVI